jgi:serine O-acetyltransferase
MQTIQSKKDLEYYINADRISMGRQSAYSVKSKIIQAFFPDYRWKYQVLMRKIEYRINCKKGIVNKIILFYLTYLYNKLGVKLLINIYPNTCGPGLNIAHTGPIRISKGTKIGKNCRIHISTNIGIQAGTSDESAIIGDNVYIGPGVKFVSPCRIANNVAIGANSVVTKSFLEEGIVIAGVPAKVIKKNIDTRSMLIAGTELLDKGIFESSGHTSSELHSKGIYS